MGATPARIGSAAAVLRRVVEGSVKRGADHALTDGKITGQTSATISAQRNPASSRAMAAATTERTFLWAASWRNRRDRRISAAHERATVSGGTPCWPSLMPTPTLGLCW